MAVSCFYAIGVSLTQQIPSPNLYRYKKGADRCIYPIGALDCL